MNLSTYLKEIQRELKLTTFPSQYTVINYSLFVIIFTGIMAVYLGSLDLGFGEVIIQGINAVKNSEVMTAASTATSTASSTDLINLISTTTTK